MNEIIEQEQKWTKYWKTRAEELTETVLALQKKKWSHTKFASSEEQAWGLLEAETRRRARLQEENAKLKAEIRLLKEDRDMLRRALLDEFAK